MDEHDLDDQVSIARRHDRWSVLIIGLNLAAEVANSVSNALEQYTVMTAQHANQLTYDRKFGDITRNFYK